MSSSIQQRRLQKIVTDSLVAATKTASSPRMRSSAFVQSLATALSEFAMEDLPGEHLASLARGQDKSNYAKFGLTELLWDAVVVRVVAPASGHNPMRQVISGIWVVESELADNFTAITKDMNKLMLARSDNRMLVIQENQVRRHETDLAKWCDSANVACWLAGVDKPEDWGSPSQVSVRRMGPQ